MNPVIQHLACSPAAGGARLARLELSRRCINELATSFRHFVANQLNQLRGCRIQNLPVQPGLLPDILAGFLGGPFRTAGHVLDREFFHHDQCVFSGQPGAELVMVLQALPCLS